MGGQVIGGEFNANNGKSAYQVEVLKGNQAYDVVIDATTGNILSSKVDRVDKVDSGNEQDEGNEANESHETAHNLNNATLAVNAIQAV